MLKPSDNLHTHRHCFGAPCCLGLLLILSCTFAPIARAAPASSMDTVYEPRTGDDYVYVVNPDHDSVSVVNAVSGNRIAEIPVGDEPRSLALDGLGYLWVTNKAQASLSIISTSSLSVVNTLPGPPASRPHGIVIDTHANRAYVVLEALGALYQIDTISGALINSANVGNHPREVSINDTGTLLYLPRFITAPVAGENGLNPATGGGEIVMLATADMSATGSIAIPFNRAASGVDTNSSARGIPNYLRSLAISPDGTQAALPAKIDNIHRGTRRDGLRREHNVLTRGILSTIDLSSNSEILSRRIEFVNNSQPTAVAYSSDGNHLYAVHEGSRAFEVIDVRTGAIQYQATLGFAPAGVVVSSDGRQVFVHNWLSRTLSIIDAAAVSSGGAAPVIRTVSLVSEEALSNTLLLGKRLFHDSADPRLSAQRYISCAACHDEGGQDGRVYDFSDVGEGLRNTADMRGRGNMEDGNVHWTANFDEIQDFESAVREIFGGTGLMTDDDFNATSVAIDPDRMKTGRSFALDALAAFVDTFDDHGLSPYRLSNGALTSQALSGRQVFENVSCATCHSGSNFTDSPLGGSHNIGTVDADTGFRFGQPLINGGLDTPTLQGLWNSGPYLHDGSALTVQSAIMAHTLNMPVSLSSLSSSELDHLAAYVLQIDDAEPAPQPPVVNPPNPDTFSTFASINVDGNMNDWSTDSLLANDPRDATSDADQLDYQTVWMANDDTSLYLRYRNHLPGNARLTWGYGQAIDVNGASIGYRPAGNRVPIGVDYLIEEQSIYRYTGDGNSWSWAWVARIPIAFNGRDAELSVSRTLLGNPDSFDVFMYADNNAIGGTAIDFIPDTVSNTGAAFDTRYFSYEFAGSSTPAPAPPPADNPVVYSNPVASLDVDGSSIDWQGLAFFPPDSNDVTEGPNVIDYLQAGTAHDSNNFYFGWNNDGPTRITWGNAIFVDTDLNFNSGFRGFQNDSPIGIDYLIEAASVYRYTGNGNSWNWQWVGQTFPVADGNNLELRVPAHLLGSPTTMDLFFYGDSSAIGGSGIDFYPDSADDTNAAITSRRFRYTRNSALAAASVAGFIQAHQSQD